MSVFFLSVFFVIWIWGNWDLEWTTSLYLGPHNGLPVFIWAPEWTTSLYLGPQGYSWGPCGPSPKFGTLFGLQDAPTIKEPIRNPILSPVF